MDISLPASEASSILCFVLASQAYHARSYTKKDYLLNFSAGFFLLGLSFVILVPLALGMKFPGNFEDADDIINYPVFALMQTAGFVLIALGYSQRSAARKVLLSLVGFLVLLVFLVLLSGSVVPASVDIVFYIINTSLLGYVLYHMLKIMPPTGLVFAGFLFLAIHEYTALIGSVSESIYNYPDEGAFLIGDMIRLVALCLLFLSFLATRKQVTALEIMRRSQIA